MERSSPEVSHSLGLGPWTGCCSISTERSIELNGVNAGAVAFSGAGKRREYVAIMIDVSVKLASVRGQIIYRKSTIVSKSNRGFYTLAVAAGIFSSISGMELLFSYAGRCEQPLHSC